MDNARHGLQHVHEDGADLGLCPPDSSSGDEGLEQVVGQRVLQAAMAGPESG